MEKKDMGKSFKKLTSLITKSSQKFITSFLDDSINEKREQKVIQQKVNLAIAKQSLVVIQLKSSETMTSYETISGWISKNKENANTILIKLQKDQQFRIVTLSQIRKIRLLSLRSKQRITAD